MDVSWLGFGFDFGSRAWDAWQHYTAPLNSDEYIKRYVSSVNDAIELMLSLPALRPDELKQSTRELLKSTSLVVNVQSSKQRAFGRFAGNRRKLIMLMTPFMQVLGHCIARLHASEKGADAN